MKMRITLYAPGSAGHLEYEVTAEEQKFLDCLSKKWNQRNTSPDQPYMHVEVI